MHPTSCQEHNVIVFPIARKCSGHRQSTCKCWLLAVQQSTGKREREEMWMRKRSPVVGQTKIMNVFSATMESDVSCSQAVIKSVITSSAHTIWIGIELWIDAIHGYTRIQRCCCCCCCYCCIFVMSGPNNLLWTLLTLCQLKERGNILMEFTSLHRVDSTIASWVPCHGYNIFLLTLGAICNYELIRSEKTHTRGIAKNLLGIRV